VHRFQVSVTILSPRCTHRIISTYWPKLRGSPLSKAVKEDIEQREMRIQARKARKLRQPKAENLRLAPKSSQPHLNQTKEPLICFTARYSWLGLELGNETLVAPKLARISWPFGNVNSRKCLPTESILRIRS